MRYYNADGGEAEMCGNGARCFARYLNRLHDSHSAGSRFETIAGVISAEFLGDSVRIRMSEPHSLALNQIVPVRAGSRGPFDQHRRASCRRLRR